MQWLRPLPSIALQTRGKYALKKIRSYHRSYKSAVRWGTEGGARGSRTALRVPGESHSNHYFDSELAEAVTVSLLLTTHPILSLSPPLPPLHLFPAPKSFPMSTLRIAGAGAGADADADAAAGAVSDAVMPLLFAGDPPF